MQELHIEGAANHDDPELCVGVPQGRSEALAGACVGRVIEPRNQCDRGADAVLQAEGHIAGSATRELSEDPARSESQSHAQNLHAREPGGPMLARLVDHQAGRSGKAKAAIRR